MYTRGILVLICFFMVLFSCEAQAYEEPYYDSGSVYMGNQNQNSGVTEEYPVINMMEQKIFGSSFSGQDIYERLNRLELRLFGAVSQKSLSDRMDLLSASVFGQDNPRYESSSASSSPDSSGGYSAYPQEYQGYNASSVNDYLNDLLMKLEEQLLNQTYRYDSPESRVARLETKLFNQTSPGYPINERISRIAAVANAQPSNDLYKDMAQLNNMQNIGQGVGLAAIILMIIASLVL